MKGLWKMINSLERMMKDQIETARHFYHKGFFDSLPKTTVSGKMFNSHRLLHYEEVSYLNSLYTRLILNFRLLIFNRQSKSFKGPTGRWIQKHSWHVIPKQSNRWWVSYTLQKRKKSFLLIIMNLLSLWKLKKNELFGWMYQKFLPIFGKLGGETCTESLEKWQVKLLTTFLQSTNQKAITWWSIFLETLLRNTNKLIKQLLNSVIS